MRLFFKKVLLGLGIPVFGLSLFEILMPPNLFTHRPWEALAYQSRIPRHAIFYPNSNISMMSTGDLVYYTDKSIKRQENWITDKLGFRNDEFFDQADILFVGDSYTAGTGLNQNDLISNKVKQKSGFRLKVYNMAPCSFSQLDYYLKEGIIKKPKIIVYEVAERFVS